MKAGGAMRKAVLILILATLSNSAMADWVKFTEPQDKHFTIYINPPTIHKNGNQVRMWLLQDFNRTQISDGELPYLSLKAKYEYDCIEEQSRLISIIDYSKNMGNGAVTFSNDFESPKWESVAPETIDESLLKYVCRKK